MGLFKMINRAAEVAGAMAATVASPPPAGTGGPCDLAGDWVPCRHDEWRNRNLGPSHKSRARAAHTRVSYDVHGRGTGRVGELTCQYSVSTIAPGQYTATAKVPLLLWSATDGNLTLYQDGTLEVQYPSNGIVEYWRRADGGAYSRAPSSCTSLYSKYEPSSMPSRPLKLALRHCSGAAGSLLGASDIGWHWGVVVGEENDCYEVAGWMAVQGPHGLVAASTPLATKTKPTHLSQYHAYLPLPQATQKSDGDIEAFIRLWVRNHPIYNVLGPNCQTFVEDLFTFLCGQNLPFAKSANRLDTFGRGDGPEHHPSTKWLRPEMRPR